MNIFTVGQDQTVYLADLGKAKDDLLTQLSVFPMKLEGGGLANGWIFQVIQVLA